MTKLSGRECYTGECHLERNTVTKGLGHRVQTSEKRPGNGEAEPRSNGVRSREDWSAGRGADCRLGNEAEVSSDC